MYIVSLLAIVLSLLSTFSSTALAYEIFRKGDLAVSVFAKPIPVRFEIGKFLEKEGFIISATTPDGITGEDLYHYLPKGVTRACLIIPFGGVGAGSYPDVLTVIKCIAGGNLQENTDNWKDVGAVNNKDPETKYFGEMKKLLAIK